MCNCIECIGDQLEPRLAPWPDFIGRDIYEGDTIEHPSGEHGTVVFLSQETDPGDQWRVDYGSADLSRLCLQIGDKGRAVVTPNAKVSGVGTASAGLPGYAAGGNGERK